MSKVEYRTMGSLSPCPGGVSSSDRRGPTFFGLDPYARDGKVSGVSYQFKTKPFPHQLTEFEVSGSMEQRALWWEPGTGKTKPTIDTAGNLFELGECNAMLVLAPQGVHAQWTRDQVPTHLRDDVAERTRTFTWNTKRSTTKGFKAEFDAFMKAEGHKILSMTYSAVMTDRGAKAAKALMQKHNTLFVLDEAHNIKTPGAKRTKRIHAAAKHAIHRRVLTGTPVDDNPFDIYSQLRFVDPDIWKSLGISTFSAFKATFGIWEKRHLRDGRSFPELISYRNLPKLRELLLSKGSRLQKADVWDGMPEKTYEKVYFELSPAQRRMYDELGDDFMTTLADGSTVTAAMAITRQIRQQQITSGYLPADDEALLRPIESDNPRVRCLRDTLDRLPGQVLLWGKYDIDVDCMAAAAKQDGYSYVTYDGRTSEDDRTAAVEAFSKGDVKLFIGKPSAAGTGTDGLQRAANTMVYYNNGFRLNHRLQSEDRLHRFGQEHTSVNYIDIVAQDTIDEYILFCLRTKRCLASEVQGDAQLASWI